MIGDRVLWTFGDTLLRAPGEDGEKLRPNTAALGRVSDPLEMEEPPCIVRILALVFSTMMFSGAMLHNDNIVDTIKAENL